MGVMGPRGMPSAHLVNIQPLRVASCRRMFAKWALVEESIESARRVGT